MGTLCYGDNLGILWRYLKDEAVDFIYVAPSFNSAQNCSAFCQKKDGKNIERPSDVAVLDERFKRSATADVKIRRAKSLEL